MTEQDRQLLRKQVRALRRAVPADVNRASSLQVCRKIAASRLYRESTHIAFFLAADGELDLDSLLRQAHADGKQCYLTVSLTDGSWTLEFCRYAPGDELRKTPLGVLEPASQTDRIPAQDLDLVLTPLVAFDERGFRMGMGKGYYDRTFSFKRADNSTTSPLNSPSSVKLLGIAHECQKVEKLDNAWWDVPLDAVMTPENIYGDSKGFE